MDTLCNFQGLRELGHEETLQVQGGNPALAVAGVAAMGTASLLLVTFMAGVYVGYTANTPQTGSSGQTQNGSGSSGSDTGTENGAGKDR